MTPIAILGASIIAALAAAGPLVAPIAGAAAVAGPLVTAGTAAAAAIGGGSLAAGGLGAAAAAANPHTAQGVQNAGAVMFNDAVGSVAGVVNPLNIPGVHIQVN